VALAGTPNSCLPLGSSSNPSQALKPTVGTGLSFRTTRGTALEAPSTPVREMGARVRVALPSASR